MLSTEEGSVSLLDSSLGKNDFAGGLIIQYFSFIFIDEPLRISHLIGPKVKLHITWMPREGKKRASLLGNLGTVIGPYPSIVL